MYEKCTAFTGNADPLKFRRLNVKLVLMLIVVCDITYKGTIVGENI